MRSDFEVENKNILSCPVCNCSVRHDNFIKHLVAVHLLERKDFLTDALECFQNSTTDCCECKFCSKLIKKTKLAGHFWKFHGNLFRESINNLEKNPNNAAQRNKFINTKVYEKCDCGKSIYYMADSKGVIRAHNIGRQKIFSDLHVCDGDQKSESVYAFNGGAIDSNRRKH
jgi:hypothetical protein